jgi:hypothetical protein
MKLCCRPPLVHLPPVCRSGRWACTSRAIRRSAAWCLALCSGPAFDTRRQGYAFVTGKASRGIAAMLRQHGFQSVVEPMSFLVDRHDHLLPGEEEAR